MNTYQDKSTHRSEQEFEEKLAQQSQEEEEEKRVKAVILKEVCKKVVEMPQNEEARHYADKFGLVITTVAWEDAARDKDSVWGPCISDMTLQVEENKLPLVRNPNFTDLSWDVSMEKIPLVVGNEKGGVLFPTSLKEYLQNFRSYLHNPKSWKGSKNSLYDAERDSHVIMSSQACFLPVMKGSETEFNVAIFNYQSSKSNPAVLVIVATSNGTSAQIIDSADGWNGQKLYFNKSGEKRSFVAQRLSDNRKETGEITGKAMTIEEMRNNVIIIIQVPLKRKIIPIDERENFFDDEDFYSAGSFGTFNKSLISSHTVNVEDAIVKVGPSRGDFVEINDLEIERDPRFPVRVTLQFYKTTDNGIIDEGVMKTIAKQIEDSRKNADFIGSLVIGGITDRPTEHIKVAHWWNNWWLTYRNMFPKYTEEEAKRKVFADGRFANSSMSQVHEKVLEILGASTTKPKTVPWLFG